MTDIHERLSAALADRYHIERELGSGGMATVYLAADLRHDRKVAIKVLKPELAAVLGAERFVVEIKTTASLQHPHILPLFDSGTANGFLFYVMPYIQGETIREKLNRETQFGIDEAIRIAREVADGLDYAHRHGVIHRDIKPENILLHDGRAIVMDFGIALAVSAAAGGRMTETGLSLGTPHYMSPEQATAEKEITPRSDVYSLASVLFEMLAGQPPHVGGSAQQIIMKIITEQAPPVMSLRKSVPPNVAGALATALEKLPADRFSSAKAFADALGDAQFTTTTTAARTRASEPGPFRKFATVAAIAAIAVLGGWFMRGWTATEVEPQTIRFTASMGRPGIDRPLITLSRDGTRVLQPYTDTTGTLRLGMRDLRSGTFTTIPGTERATFGAFSPAGDWIVFIADNKVRKVAIQGGPVATLTDSVIVDNVGVEWTATGDIIYSARASGLRRIRADGGAAEELTRIDTSRKEFAHWFPRTLPNGRAMIYTNYAKTSNVEVYDFETRRRKVLVEDAVFGRYAPSGHLLFARDAAVFAIPFDPEKLTVSGTAVPVQDDVVWEETNALAAFDIAANGTFIFLRASEWGSDGTVVWRDRLGRDTPAIETPGDYMEPRMSPDGRWIAVTNRKPKFEVWLYDTQRRALSQLTRAPASAFNALWLDNKRIVYSYENPAYELHMLPIDASAPDRVLLARSTDLYASSVSRDGRTVLATGFPGVAGLFAVPVDGNGTPKSLTAAGVEEQSGVFSPDGKWMAYSETRDGLLEVFVRTADGVGGRRPVSVGGGWQPRWTKGGREIVYLSPAGMMSAAVDPATGEASAPRLLFRFSSEPRDRTHRYDVTPDGERFLMVKRIDRVGLLPLVVTLNWRPEVGGAGATK